VLGLGNGRQHRRIGHAGETAQARRRPLRLSRRSIGTRHGVHYQAAHSQTCPWGEQPPPPHAHASPLEWVRSTRFPTQGRRGRRRDQVAEGSIEEDRV
jgi:hypothetical protein